MLKIKIVRSGHQVAEVIVDGTAEISTRCGFTAEVKEIDKKEVIPTIEDIVAESFKCEGTV